MIPKDMISIGDTVGATVADEDVDEGADCVGY